MQSAFSTFAAQATNNLFNFTQQITETTEKRQSENRQDTVFIGITRGKGQRVQNTGKQMLCYVYCIPEVSPNS